MSQLSNFLSVCCTLATRIQFLYLVSPSARKNTPVVHNDKHDYPTSKTLDHPTTPQPTKKAEVVVQEEEEAAAPAAPAPAEDSEKVTLKDDEGKEADITASLALAEVRHAWVCSI